MNPVSGSRLMGDQPSAVVPFPIGPYHWRIENDHDA